MLSSGRGGATVDMFPRGSDVAVFTGRALTERTNGLGVYGFNVTEAAVGWHSLHPKTSSGRVLGVFRVFLHDTLTLHLAHDPPDALSEGMTGFGPDVEADIAKGHTDYGASTHSAADVDALVTASHGSGSYLTAIVSGLSTFDPTTDAVFIDGAKARLDDLNDITVAQILGGTIDGGVDVQLALAAILATVLGEATVTGDTVVFKDRAGGTLATVQLSTGVAGSRLASTIVGE